MLFMFIFRFFSLSYKRWNMYLDYFNYIFKDGATDAKRVINY